MSDPVNAPTGANGRPMAWIYHEVSETVPTGNYANVKLGPSGIGRWVEDTSQDGDKGRQALYDAVSFNSGIVEERISEERELVAESVSHHGRK